MAEKLRRALDKFDKKPLEDQLEAFVRAGLITQEEAEAEAALARDATNPPKP